MELTGKAKIGDYENMSEKDKLELLKKFMLDNFDFKQLKKCGFYNKDIKKTDYQKQADRVCWFFGYDTVYQYRFETTYAHISYVEGHRPEGEPFISEFKAWHES